MKGEEKGPRTFPHNHHTFPLLLHREAAVGHHSFASCISLLRCYPTRCISERFDCPIEAWRWAAVNLLFCVKLRGPQWMQIKLNICPHLARGSDSNRRGIYIESIQRENQRCLDTVSRFECMVSLYRKKMRGNMLLRISNFKERKINQIPHSISSKPISQALLLSSYWKGRPQISPACHENRPKS